MSGHRGLGRAGRWWAQAGAAALDLVIAQQCAGCDRPGRVWCPCCAAACGGPSVPVPLNVPCRAAADHGGPAGRAVTAFKDDQVRRLATPLAGLLAKAILDALSAAGAHGAAPVWVVPIPTRRSAIRARGADHAGVLAGRAAGLLRSCGVPAHRCRAVLHIGASRDQVGLSRSQRRTNVTDTLQAAPLPPGLIVVVDDVTTSGATLQEGIRAVRAAGCEVTCAATVTHAVRSRRRASEPHHD